jgi:hypothetical protein
VLVALLVVLIMVVVLPMAQQEKLVVVVETGVLVVVIQQIVEMVGLQEEQFLDLITQSLVQLIPQQLKDCIYHNKYF